MLAVLGPEPCVKPTGAVLAIGGVGVVSIASMKWE